MSSENFSFMRRLAEADISALKKAQVSYGDSWKRRGGVGAFMMMARKWDRIENQATKTCYDVFAAARAFPGKEGVLDDIDDLIRYLMLVRAEVAVLPENDGDDGAEPTRAYVDQG